MPVIGTNSSQPEAEKSFPILRITEDHSTPVTRLFGQTFKPPYPLAGADGTARLDGPFVPSAWGFLYLFSTFCVPFTHAVPSPLWSRI